MMINENLFSVALQGSERQTGRVSVFLTRRYPFQKTRNDLFGD